MKRRGERRGGSVGVGPNVGVGSRGSLRMLSRKYGNMGKEWDKEESGTRCG